MNKHQKSSWVCQQHLSEAVTNPSLCVHLTIQWLPSLAVVALAQMTGLSPWTHLKRLSKSFGARKWKLFDGVTIKQCWDSTIPHVMIQPCIHKGEICVFLSLRYSICTLESSDCSCGALQLILLSVLAVKRSLPPGSNVHRCYSNVRRTCKGRICSYQPETIRLSVYIVIRHQYFSMERIIKGHLSRSDW